MSGRAYIKTPIQLAKLVRLFGGAGRQKKDRLTWVGVLTPSPLSRAYKLLLTYRTDDVPRVWVLDPKLEEREGKRAPHLYPGERLCLYLPKAYDWNGSMLLAETIVPWASEWLFHYEVWLATGEWCGGGEHPEGRRDSEPSQRTPWKEERWPMTA